jgi:Zn-finger nucleic acid-binding protein
MSTGWAGQRQGNECATFAAGMTIRQGGAAVLDVGRAAATSRTKRKEADPMKCPLCSVDLVMADRQGVEIDYCPKCRGVWLDRGEIDKIIERSAAAEAAQQPAPAPPPPQPAPQPQASAWTQPGAGYQQVPQPSPGYWKRDDDDDDRRKYGHSKDGYPRKRKGFLSDLLDFD